MAEMAVGVASVGGRDAHIIRSVAYNVSVVMNGDFRLLLWWAWPATFFPIILIIIV
jgi:hypothetical protein